MVYQNRVSERQVVTSQGSLTSREEKDRFSARGSFVCRCDDCRLPQIACICKYRPALEADVEFCLIMHDTEFRKPTNTGRLIADCLATTRIFKWHRTEPDPALLAFLANPSYQHWLVFPADDETQQSRIKSFMPSNHKKTSLIILDGTWQQASKMFRRSPYLNHLPLISINPEGISQYRLRRASQEHHLCTAEIAAELMKVAGEADKAAILEDYFLVFSQHYQAARSSHGVKQESDQMKRLVALNRKQQNCDSVSDHRESKTEES